MISLAFDQITIPETESGAPGARELEEPEEPAQHELLHSTLYYLTETRIQKSFYRCLAPGSVNDTMGFYLVMKSVTEPQTGHKKTIAKCSFA